MTEKEIIQGCINSDRRCQNLLYKNYYPLMSSIALRYYTDIDEAKQAINYGFLKVLQKIESHNTKYALATWIRNILVHHIIDEYRKNKKYKDTIQLDDSQDMVNGYDVNLVESNWEYEELRSFLFEIPEINRNVFNLFAIDGYKHKEIGAILGISEGASKWHLNRARKKLQDLMKKHEPIQKKNEVITQQRA